MHVIGALFRGKFLDRLRAACRGGQLVLGDHGAQPLDPQAFDRFLSQLYRKAWVVKPFQPAAHVFHLAGEKGNDETLVCFLFPFPSVILSRVPLSVAAPLCDALDRTNRGTDAGRNGDRGG